MTTRRPLTDKQRRLVDALQRHLSDHGTLPAAAELAAAAGMRSESAVRTQLGWLVEHGYLRHDDTQPGGLRIVQVAP